MFTGRVLITGGSGTIGNAILKRATAEDWPCRFSIYSRSEFLQAKMRGVYPNVSYILGDIRDQERTTAVIAGHDTVIHAAAMKRIPEAEEQPEECYKTNVLGSINVIKACKVGGVKRAIFLSTDKACTPITAYGASKLMMEKAIQAQFVEPTIFTAVRYGNVLESRGSVIPIWRKQAKEGKPVTITDKRMTRFFISPQTAVNYIIEASKLGAGNVYIPKMKAINLLDMARIISPDSQYKVIGKRSTERLHEYLISPEEEGRDVGHGYILDERGYMGNMWRSNTAPQFTNEEFVALLDEVGL